MGRPILIITGVLLIIFGITQASITNRHITMVERSATYGSSSQARNIATSMVDAAIGELNKNINWRTGLSHPAFLGGNGSISVLDNLADSTIDPNSLVLLANGTYGNETATIRVGMAKHSFARYAYFTHNETNAWFITADTVRGPLHSNDQIRMFGRPLFRGDVTSTRDYIKYNAATDPNFEGSTDWNHAVVTIPTDLSELTSMTAVANGGLGQYNQQLRVTFNDNGTILLETRPSSSSSWAVDQTVSAADFNGVISSTQDVQVRGTVNGRFTLHSGKSIRVISDVTYKSNPNTNPLSTDMLGMVAMDNIIIDKNAHTVNNGSSIEIHASLMAVNGSFTVEDFDKGSPRGTLKVLGGIVQHTRAPVGRGTFNTSNGTVNIQNGFIKDYHYDNRFSSTWPPGFPYRDRYIVINWQE